MTKGKRDWQPRELRLVAEYLQVKYAKWPYRMRVRLGSIHDKLRVPKMDLTEERLGGVWRRWADAVVFKPDQIIIIEGSIRCDPGDISKLQLYRSLLPHTPELEPYANLPIALELVYAMKDEVIEQLAREAGISVVHYEPVWLGDYLAILYPRERRVPLTNINDLKK